MTNQELRAKAEAMLKDQKFSDFRDLIAASEGGTYNRLFGFDNQGRPRYFSDFTKFGVAFGSQPVPGSEPTRRKVVSVSGKSGTGVFPSASR